MRKAVTGTLILPQEGQITGVYARVDEDGQPYVGIAYGEVDQVLSLSGAEALGVALIQAAAIGRQRLAEKENTDDKATD